MKGTTGPRESPNRGASRRRAPTFQPRFTLSLLYLAGFFFLYAILLILPELLGVLAEVAPGPEQQELAREVAREAARPRLVIAAALSLLTTAAGGYYRVLPGMRTPG